MVKAKTKKEEAVTKASDGSRPPVVVVLGHVDHGKTTVLDKIREANVVARESGGITQHVGAYTVTHNGKTLTFLDTPGHEAFSAMRSRGAKVADVAVLVVAADDGVKPQTRESIEAIQSADIPFVVAINKVDKNNADIERTKTELTEAGVLLEGWGGDVPNVEISAKQGQGIPELLELIALVGEMAELTGDGEKSAEGVVVESSRDTQRGAVVTLLVKNGTLRVGDIVAAGAVTGKIKAMENFTGKAMKEAGPSIPAVVLGFNDVPRVGDVFRVMEDEGAALEAAKEEASYREFEQLIAGEKPQEELVMVLKADVLGSLEAIVDEFKKLKNDVVALRIAGADTGEISENDVKRAAAVGAVVVGFRVKVKTSVSMFAERQGVQVASFDVIYELIDFVKQAMQGKAPKEVKREELGEVTLLATFQKDLPKQVVGGKVRKGVIREDAMFEIVRDEETVTARGRIVSLQQEKIPVPEVKQGNECGFMVKFSEGGPAREGDSVRIFLEEVNTPELFS